MEVIRIIYKKIKIKKIKTNKVLLYAAMIILVAFTSLPLVYMVSTAFKPLDELFLFPPRFFVRHPTLQNIINLLTAMSSSDVPFTRYVFNSIVITVLNVLGTVIISSMGAYALSKLEIRAANKIFPIIVASLMFSPHVTGIPAYIVVNMLKLTNTYWAVILPKLAISYNFFLIKQFADQIPEEILEAARVEGAGEWAVYSKIAMPMMKPAVSTLVVFSFISNWNDYFGPLVYLNNQAMKTLPLAIQAIGASIARAGAMSAAAFLTTLPTILVYVFMQSRVLKTMAYSGIKA